MIDQNIPKNDFSVINSEQFKKFENNPTASYKSKIQSNQQLVSFDVVPLFTNKPIDFNIDVIIKHIYENKEIQTNITKAGMKEIIWLCTKSVHFSFCGETFRQTKKGVAMRSPLGSVSAGIFMVEL